VINAWGAVKGWPVKNWCLAWVDSDEAGHTTIQADSEIILIPFIDTGGNYLPLSAIVSDVAPAHRTNIANWLEARNIPTEWVTGSMKIGQVLKRLVQYFYLLHRLGSDYPEYSLDSAISTIPTAKRNRILNWMQDNGITTGDIVLTWTVRQVLNRMVTQYQGVSPPKRFGEELGDS
jgi:hypothetical protein